MAYTSISIVAPISAKEGERVPVEARIRNLTSYDIEATATIGRMDGTVLRFGAIHKWLSPGQTKSWYDSFIMPNKGVAVYVESWTPMPELGGVWRTDNRAGVSIDLEVAPTTFHLSVLVPSWATGGYVDPGSGGYVDPGSGDYPAYSTVKLTAHPLSGYQFTGWGRDAGGTSTTYNLYMNSDKNVEAYFEKVPVPEYQGSIAKKELEYNDTRKSIPVY